MSDTLEALMRHGKVPVEAARKTLHTKNLYSAKNFSKVTAMIRHPELTHEDYSKFRKMHGSEFDFHLAEAPHLPQKTQEEILNDSDNVNNFGGNFIDGSTKSDIIARYLTTDNVDPHPEALEKASATMHRSSYPAEIFNAIVDNKKAPSKSLSNLAGFMLQNSHFKIRPAHFKKLFDHPNIKQETIKYVHNNSMDDVHDLAKEYLK